MTVWCCRAYPTSNSLQAWQPSSRGSCCRLDGKAVAGWTRGDKRRKAQDVIDLALEDQDLDPSARAAEAMVASELPREREGNKRPQVRSIDLAGQDVESGHRWSGNSRMPRSEPRGTAITGRRGWGLATLCWSRARVVDVPAFPGRLLLAVGYRIGLAALPHGRLVVPGHHRGRRHGSGGQWAAFCAPAAVAQSNPDAGVFTCMSRRGRSFGARGRIRNFPGVRSRDPKKWLNRILMTRATSQYMVWI
eukprot:SAG22_NODE_1484_length_4324_cov_4.105799_3_plen_248_part_00